MPHVGQEMLTLSGTHDFTPFVEFMILPIRLRMNDSGLFAWISLTALSPTYFIDI